MRAPSERALSVLFEAHEILPSHQPEFRVFVVQLVEWLNTQANKSTSNRRQQVRTLKKAGAYLKKLHELMNACDGPMNDRALRNVGLKISQMIDPSWIARTKLRGAGSMGSLLTNPSFHGNSHEQWLFVEKARLDIVQSNAETILDILLKNIETAIAMTLTPVIHKPDRGGRTEKIERRYAIINLAEIFSWSGQRPTGAVGSRFSAFVEDFFQLTGWQSQMRGLDDAIPDAISRWKNLPKNGPGFSLAHSRRTG